MIFAALLLLCTSICCSVAQDEQRNLTLLVFLPEKPNQPIKFPFGAEMAGGAVWAALEKVKEDRILPNVNIIAEFENSHCNPLLGLGRAHETFDRKKYVGIIGIQCSRVCVHVGRLASYLELPVFTGLCQANDMNNKNEFRTLTRFLANFALTAVALTEFMHTYNWDRMGLVAESMTDHIWTDTFDAITLTAPTQNVTIATSTVIMPGDDLEKVLLETARLSRIIVTAMNGPMFRRFMVLAHKHGLTNGDYIFLAVTYYKQRRMFGVYEWNQNDEYDDIVREAYRSVFFFSYFNREARKEYSIFSDYVRKFSYDRFQFEYMENEEVPYPAANLYEATYLFAVAVNETISEGNDPMADGIALSRRVWGRSFQSLTGGVTLTENGDRAQAYMVRHLQDPDAEDVVVVGEHFSINQSMMLLPTEEILWPGPDGPPADTPECGYDGEFCIVDKYAALIRVVGIMCGVLAAIIIAATVIVTLVYRRLKWQKELSDMRWKIDFEELLLEGKNKSTTRSGGSVGAFSQLSLISAATVGSKEQQFITNGFYKGQSVALKSIPHINNVDLSNNKFLTEMIMLHDLHHSHIAKFIGACLNAPTTYLVTEYCMKGSLEDLLENEGIQLDWAFKCSLMNDILQGLSYLHGTYLHCHGNLKSSNCVVDGRFVVKLTDFGLHSWHHSPEKKAKDLLWTAPELVTSGMKALPGNAAGDVYAFGIILQEIVCREGPFCLKDMDLSPQEIMERVVARTEPPLRPSIDPKDCSPDMQGLMKFCWDTMPDNRPSLSDIKKTVKGAAPGNSGKSMNLVDNLLTRMEQYATNLEGLVEERTSQYMDEKRKAEDLLHRLLPRSIADQLQTYGGVAPETYECVSIYFSDVVHFTALCSESTPMQVVNMLNDLYTLFDRIISEFNVYKVETIGDAYMAVSGLPVRIGDQHVVEICKMALCLQRNVTHFKVAHKKEYQLMLRIGIHSGSCVAGVVGLTMPRYCLFGDTVNTASRMESNGEALKIHISSTTHELLSQQPGFEMEYRGEVPMKGKGNMKTYWLLSGPTKGKKHHHTSNVTEI